MSDTETDSTDRPGRVLSNRMIVTCAAFLGILALAMAWLLLARFGDGTPAGNARLDAVRTVGTLVLGAGGGVALLLTARRQQTAERELVEKRRELALRERAQAHSERVQLHAEKVAADTHAHQIRVAESSETDAAARRVTELFDTAVDKLGSDKAAVRFGGLYALERLGTHDPDQREAIVKVLCAYLRMPYQAIGADPRPDTEESAKAHHRNRREEHEVRRAVERLLGAHLRPGSNAEPVAAYWSGVSLDLAGATLVEADWADCTFPAPVDFRDSVFLTGGSFDRCRFTDTATFSGAVFENSVNFEESKFESGALFDRAKFDANAYFGGVEFHNGSWFHSAIFGAKAHFDDTYFRYRTTLRDAQFDAETLFALVSKVHNFSRARVRFGAAADVPAQEEFWIDLTPVGLDEDHVREHTSRMTADQATAFTGVLAELELLVSDSR